MKHRILPLILTCLMVPLGIGLIAAGQLRLEAIAQASTPITDIFTPTPLINDVPIGASPTSPPTSTPNPIPTPTPTPTPTPYTHNEIEVSCDSTGQQLTFVPQGYLVIHIVLEEDPPVTFPLVRRVAWSDRMTTGKEWQAFSFESMENLPLELKDRCEAWSPDQDGLWTRGTRTQIFLPTVRNDGSP